MLASLHIENIAVIKCVDIDFSDGLNVLTGETGAGKSIIIDSINLILGARADKDLVRAGESRAFVSAVFTGVDGAVLTTCRDAGIACDDAELMLSREVYTDGKSGARINGRSIPLTILRDVAARLVTIHGQHDNQKLLKSETHLSYLDAYADCATLRASYAAAYREYTQAKSAMEQSEVDEIEKARRVELLSYQINDIESAKLKEGEEETLLDTKKKIKNLEKIKKNTSIVYRALYDNEKGVSACALVDRAYAAIETISEEIDDAQVLLSKLEECRNMLSDVAYRADALMPELNGDPDRILNKIETRLAQIDRIKHKYGVDIAQVLAFRDSLKEQLSELENADQTAKMRREQYEAARVAALAVGKELSQVRADAARSLEREICAQLAYLDMGGVRFCVDLSVGGEPMPNGIDIAEFLICANAGEEYHPLAKVASGGELSRVMLAMKCVLAAADPIGLMIFDEVDTGISGKTSLKIGRRLRDLSRTSQVMCVTHSAQIASLAKTHFLISKREQSSRVYCTVEPLAHDGRILEIARIIGGETITPTVTATAEELLRQAEITD